MYKGAKHGASYFEFQPRELVNVCLRCKKKSCIGTCPAYRAAERSIRTSARMGKRESMDGSQEDECRNDDGGEICAI